MYVREGVISPQSLQYGHGGSGGERSGPVVRAVPYLPRRREGIIDLPEILILLGSKVKERSIQQTFWLNYAEWQSSTKSELVL